MPLYQIRSISPLGAKTFKHVETFAEAEHAARDAKALAHTGVRIVELMSGAMTVPNCQSEGAGKED
ncbi:hypothetical protein [Candidatus Viadribacter manganicus]|uniref:Uncharacterized protein n=1 Tax=Candidatus Viadribacter manganicus TaxID=1759059 RepID=A0A1B1AGN7_9PROT|nr:hypothetical protein [Candidatus Viadribacter manganicus]ANP45701.1 hypothetical protein ATE48_07105 [Candidatus Viadribacter manganicus]